MAILKSWKITVQPTQEGVRIRTTSAGGDQVAALVAETVEEALRKLARKTR